MLTVEETALQSQPPFDVREAQKAPQTRDASQRRSRAGAKEDEETQMTTWAEFMREIKDEAERDDAASELFELAESLRGQRYVLQGFRNPKLTPEQLANEARKK